MPRRQKVWSQPKRYILCLEKPKNQLLNKTLFHPKADGLKRLILQLQIFSYVFMAPGPMVYVDESGLALELLTSIPSNSVIGLDHAIFHQRGEALEAIEKAGQRVEFLPPDSPDLNSIGKKWAPAKSIRPKFGYSPEELLSDSNL